MRHPLSLLSLLTPNPARDSLLQFHPSFTIRVPAVSADREWVHATKQRKTRAKV